MTLRGHRPKVDIIRMITTTMGGVTRYMSCKKPDVAQRLRRVKTETDKEIVASYEAQRKKMRAIKEVRVKMGINENGDEKKNGRNQTKKKRKGMRKCEKV